jgi:hypothetical protein
MSGRGTINRTEELEQTLLQSIRAAKDKLKKYECGGADPRYTSFANPSDFQDHRPCSKERESRVLQPLASNTAPTSSAMPHSQPRRDSSADPTSPAVVKAIASMQERVTLL